MTTPVSHRPSTAATVVMVISLAIGPWASALLLRLAQFGQSPPDALAWPVLVLVGLLLAAPAATAAQHLTQRHALVIAGFAASLALAGALLAGFPLASALPVGVTLLGMALLQRLASRTAALYGAALVYIGCTVLANFTLDSFIPVGDFFLVNVGTFFFGVTFTQRDRLHRFGRGVVYRVIVLAAGANVLAALALETPLRYVTVSFLAIVISETADTEIYQRLLHRRWIARVAGSNAVSAPLDTILFTTLAFAGAPFASAAWMLQVIVTDVFVKYGASMIAAITLLSRPEWVPRTPAEERAAATR